MAFEPSGKPALLVAAMRAAPDKPVWSAGEAAEVMGIARGNLPAYLRASIDNGVIFQKVEDGRSYYSLKPIEPGAPATLLIPTLRKPGDWVPPVMTPPRGSTGHVPRQPLPEPLHHFIASLEATQAAASDGCEVDAPPEPEPAPRPEPKAPKKLRAAPEPEPEEDVPEAFNVCRWLDGDIDLYGLLETDDGAMRIPADKVPQLLKLLGGVPT